MRRTLSGRSLLIDRPSPASLAKACLLGATFLVSQGCEPERPLKPLNTASSAAGANAPANAKADKLPQGKIEVTEDGFVSLGVPPESPSTVETKAPLATAKPSSEIKPLSPKSTGADSDAGTGSIEISSAADEEVKLPNKSVGDEPAKPATVASLAATATTVEKSQQSAPNFDEKAQAIAPDWPKPEALLFITGQQHGYIEPCGCTGLENQKGGLNRRDTLLTQLRERGWNVVPMDVGNFERRTGIQAEIKLQTTVKALKEMDYRAATLGVDDLKLSSQELLALSASDDTVQTPFISANAYILVEEYMPKTRIVEAGGRKIGITAVLGDSFAAQLKDSTDITLAPAVESLRKVVAELKSKKCDYIVLLSHAKLSESRAYATEVPGIDLIASAGDYPEPDFQLEEIEGSQSKLVQVGAKGMFTCLVALYPDTAEPVRYQRVALSSQFADSPRMMKLFSDYQKQLEEKGFDGLRVPVQALDDGLKFVGSEKCGECHTKAFDVWKNSEHFTATESLVHPPNSRSMIPRHFDPECLSCHVTGWNPQRYYPYSSGFESIEKTPMLTGNGCENCHGAGSAHSDAESGDTSADQAMLIALREKMRLPLSEAKDRCTQCHDQDNSPEFQHDGSFEEYWEQIKHPGKD